jgi:hypothetical protein
LFYGSATTTTSFAIERISAGVSVSYFHYLDSSVTLNNWHHIVATFDGYNLILYRNGVAVGSVVQSTGITNTTAVVKIGVLSGTQYFNGRISATRIYNVALTADNVKQNFNAIRGRYGI